MKRSISKLRFILKSKSGETLMEGIVSILVFTVLIAAITTMISVSLRITSRATENADIMQANANAALAGDLLAADVSVIDGEDIVLKIGDTTVSTVPITIYKAGGFVSFDPRP